MILDQRRVQGLNRRPEEEATGVAVWIGAPKERVKEPAKGALQEVAMENKPMEQNPLVVGRVRMEKAAKAGREEVLIGVRAGIE